MHIWLMTAPVAQGLEEFRSMLLVGGMSRALSRSAWNVFTFRSRHRTSRVRRLELYGVRLLSRRFPVRACMIERSIRAAKARIGRSICSTFLASFSIRFPGSFAGIPGDRGSSAACLGLYRGLLGVCSPSGIVTEYLGLDVSSFMASGFSSQIPCLVAHVFSLKCYKRGVSQSLNSQS
jgi:hypothetical protein